LLQPNLFLILKPLLPERRKNIKGENPYVFDERLFVEIWHVLRTGFQWKALPRSLAARVPPLTIAYRNGSNWAFLGSFDGESMQGPAEIGVVEH
jgi:transposase